MERYLVLLFKFNKLHKLLKKKKNSKKKYILSIQFNQISNLSFKIPEIFKATSDIWQLTVVFNFFIFYLNTILAFLPLSLFFNFLLRVYWFSYFC